jgi:hypothetical protein
MVAAAHEDVGLDADLAKLRHGLLRGLGLQLTRRLEVGHERDVDENHILGPTSSANCRIASRNGSPSMSPVVPPISVMSTSTSLAPANRCAP